MAIIGQREADAGTAAVRVRGAGNKQDVIPVEALLERLVAEARERRLPA
jgi:threonyl-tRNA synthetase